MPWHPDGSDRDWPRFSPLAVHAYRWSGVRLAGLGRLFVRRPPGGSSPGVDRLPGAFGRQVRRNNLTAGSPAG